MDTIFMNFKNGETPESYRLLFDLSDNINLRTSDRYVAF